QKVGSVFSLTGSQTLEVHIALVSGYYHSNVNQPASFTVAWANGTSGANPSTMTFTNTPIGKVSNADSGQLGQPITLSGTVKLNNGGSLLTLS
ncbi:MAG TPA: hypothetical protein VI111_04280, partial [Thermoleophilaceae bacterium]